MNRAQFLKRCALIAAGVVAADQLELLERLTWEPKKFWTGWAPRETRIPIVIHHAPGLAMIADGGFECVMSTPDIQWVTPVELQQVRGRLRAGGIESIDYLKGDLSGPLFSVSV